jgi:putative transposase
MTYQPNDTPPAAWLQAVTNDGFEALPELMRVLFNAAMQAERQAYLGVEPYQRDERRRDQANGFKPKTVKTRVGAVTFDIPQVRHGDFYPQALTKGLRSERALTLALAEMYVQGVSTRRVSAILEHLCGTEVSSSQVSRAMAELDEGLGPWRERGLGPCPYLLLDARYEKGREGGTVRDAAVLIAIGVGTDGKRRVLGVSVSLSEHEVHWRTFLQRLVERGLGGVQLITSDAHEGLKAARRAVFGGVAWQRCQFHLQQNAQSYVTKVERKAEVAADIRAIFTAPDRAEAEARLAKTVQKYTQSMPRLAAWLQEAIPEGLTVFAVPVAHQRLLRTTNGLERVNQSVRQRTRVVGIFPNAASCLRLISAVLMELSDEWEAGKAYLTFPAT